MANYTLNYTGEKVDELLNKIDTAFGETTVMGDTLTWDGNTDGLTAVDLGGAYAYRVSDFVPTEDDLANGGTIIVKGKSSDGSSFDITTTPALGDDEGLVFLLADYLAVLLVIPNDGFELEGVVFAEKGLYTFPIIAQLDSLSLTINGYTGFETTKITPIEPKYMPKISIDVTGFTNDDGMRVNETIPYTPLYDHFFKGGDVEFVSSYEDSGTKAKTSMRAVSCSYIEDGTGFKAVTFAAVVAMTGIIEKIQFRTP